MKEKFERKIKKLLSRYNHNLLKEMLLAEFKTYEYNSILGIFWSLLNPSITLAILYFVFERKFGHDVRFYPLFLLVGVVTVNFFITATSKMLGCIYYNWNTILNSTIPREDFVLADLFTLTYKFFIELSLCWILSIFYGAFAWQSIPLALPLLSAYVGLLLGIGLILSLLYCVAIDIEHIWRVLSRLFLFITPVFYSLDHITPTLGKLIYWLNPISPFLIAFRQILIWDNTFNITNYLYCFLLGYGFLMFGYFIFTVSENIVIEKT